MAHVEAFQRTLRKVVHTVTDYEGFYSIEVPPPEDGRMLAAIEVQDASGLAFKYSPGFTNVWPGDRVYHVEVDEYQRIMVKFGLLDVVGYQPAVGEKNHPGVDRVQRRCAPGIGQPLHAGVRLQPRLTARSRWSTWS